MSGDRIVRTSVNIPEELYLLARHYGLKNLNEFVRDALQGFVDGQEEPVSDTVSMRARQIAVDLRIKSMQQRKIVQDSELERIEREKLAMSRAALIEQVTRSQVARQTFTRTFLPEYDDKWSTAESIRKRLVDEIAHECQIDLQWRDVEQAVRKAVQS